MDDNIRSKLAEISAQWRSAGKIGPAISKSVSQAYELGKAEGIKEGLRRAAEIAKQQNDVHAENLRMGKGTWPQKDYIRDEIWHQWEGQERASRRIAAAILKEIGE